MKSTKLTTGKFLVCVHKTKFNVKMRGKKHSIAFIINIIMTLKMS